MGATSGPGAVVRNVNASPLSGIGRHNPAKQNQSSPSFVNFHFCFGDSVPVNSKKCDAGIRQRPTGNRRSSERKLMMGAPLDRALIGRPDVLAWLQVGGSFGPSDRISGLAEGREIIAIRNMVAETVAHSRMPLGDELIMPPSSPRLLRIAPESNESGPPAAFSRPWVGALVKLKANDRALDMIASGQGVREAASEAA
jgi:hypothetical protein